MPLCNYKNGFVDMPGILDSLCMPYMEFLIHIRHQIRTGKALTLQGALRNTLSKEITLNDSANVFLTQVPHFRQVALTHGAKLKRSAFWGNSTKDKRTRIKVIDELIKIEKSYGKKD